MALSKVGQQILEECCIKSGSAESSITVLAAGVLREEQALQAA